MATHCSVLDGKVQEQRSLKGCSPCGRKEPDMTEKRSTQTRVYVSGTGCIQGFTSCLKPPWSKCKTCDSLISVLMWTCYKPEGCITWCEPVKSLRATLCSLTPGTQLKMVSIYLNPQLWQALDFGLVKLWKQELIFKVVVFFFQIDKYFWIKALWARPASLGLVLS